MLFAGVDGPARRSALVASACVLLAGATALVAPPLQASAAPTSVVVLAAPTVESVREQIRVLDQQVHAAGVLQARGEAKAAELEARIAQTRVEVAAAQARLEAARTRSGRLAAQAYRTGSSSSGLAQVVLAEDPDAVLSGSNVLGRLQQRQGLALDRVRDAGTALAAKQAALAAGLRSLQEIRASGEARRRALTTQRATAAALLGSLQAAQRRTVEAERAAAAAVAAKAARASAGTASRSAGRTPVTSGSCRASRSRGAERGLTSNALRIMRCGLTAFPQVDRALGVGSRGNATDHDDGRAVDFMIPSYRTGPGNDLGWRIAAWAASQPGVTYVIFDQKIYSPGRGGWRQMENRGGDTANHRDHVHVSVR